MIKIRLARGGRVHKPVYTIVATDARNPRDGRFIQKLGQYDPAREETLSGVKTEELAAWVAKGAQVSDTVRTLLRKNNIKL